MKVGGWGLFSKYCMDSGIAPWARPDPGCEFLLYLGQFLKEEDSGELRLWVPRITPGPTLCLPVARLRPVCKDSARIASLQSLGTFPPFPHSNLLSISAQDPSFTQLLESKAQARPLSHPTQLAKLC